MKLKSVLILLVIIFINAESSPISELKKRAVESVLKGITTRLRILKPVVIFYANNGLKVVMHDIRYKIINDKEGFKVFKETIEKGKWVVVVGVTETEVLNAASASLPCLLSDKNKKKFFKDENLTSSDFTKLRCQPIEDVINPNALEDTNESKVDKIEKLDLSSFK